MKALERSQHFSHYESMGILFRRSRTANSTVRGLIWQNFELIRDLRALLVTCENEDDPIKNKGAIVVITLFIDFSDAHGQLTP